MLIIAMMGFASLHAQNNFTIRGHLESETGEPVPFANVALYDSKRKTFHYTPGIQPRGKGVDFCRQAIYMGCRWGQGACHTLSMTAQKTSLQSVIETYDCLT